MSAQQQSQINDTHADCSTANANDEENSKVNNNNDVDNDDDIDKKYDDAFNDYINQYIADEDGTPTSKNQYARPVQCNYNNTDYADDIITQIAQSTTHISHNQPAHFQPHVRGDVFGGDYDDDLDSFDEFDSLDLADPVLNTNIGRNPKYDSFNKIYQSFKEQEQENMQYVQHYYTTTNHVL